MRGSFINFYASGWFATVEGKITKKTKEAVVFKKIDFSFCDWSGEIHDSTEDHIWIFEKEPFSAFKVGGCVCFDVEEAYPYKRKNGTFDFGIKGVSNVEKIDSYEVPTPEEMRYAALRQLVCETCIYGETGHCGVYCLQPEGYIDEMIRKIETFDYD